jgi:hypothetical protein
MNKIKTWMTAIGGAEFKVMRLNDAAGTLLFGLGFLALWIVLCS